ncbi:MAG: DNA polymerase III subunit delta [Lachnospiraceae bacterium]|nr:DNA polymerase III subunit delta [Lachnospiraceae bacterium]
MYTIKDDIKNKSLKPVYLLYGDERFLVKHYRDQIIGTALQKKPSELAGDMNFTGFSGTAVDVKKVESSVGTMPFFAEKRVVLLEDTGWFTKSNEEAARMIKSIPETACVIFVEKDVDRKTATFKAVEKCGHAAFFDEQKLEDIQKWIVAKVKANNQKITNGAVDELIRCTALNMTAISTELEKLFAYSEGKEAIGREDVEALCHVKADDRIFDMIQFMATKKRNEALKLYYDLLELRESPTGIISMIERQFRILIAVKDLSTKGRNKKEIAEQLGLKPFVVEKAMYQARFFSQDELISALKDTAEYDRQSKFGEISDRMAVELLLVKYSEAEE